MLIYVEKQTCTRFKVFIFPDRHLCLYPMTEEASTNSTKVCLYMCLANSLNWLSGFSNIDYRYQISVKAFHRATRLHVYVVVQLSHIKSSKNVRDFATRRFTMCRQCRKLRNAGDRVVFSLVVIIFIPASHNYVCRSCYTPTTFTRVLCTRVTLVCSRVWIPWLLTRTEY